MKEELFRIIRHEPVTLWIGAGFSISAGYPSGKRLKDLIYKSLDKRTQNQVSKDSPLEVLTQDIEWILGRERLIEIVEAIFSKFQKESLDHEKVSRIPYFNTIVTTNYDALLESYFENPLILYDNQNIEEVEKDKVSIFKIHGDFNRKDKLILTKSDYENFFTNDDGNSPFWTIIKERIITNNIVFLGYSKADINVNSTLDKILKDIIRKKRQIYLVSPDYKDFEIAHLKSKGVNYVNLTGSQFIEDLTSNIRNHIIDDFSLGKIRPELFAKYLNQKGIVPDLSMGPKGSYLKSLGGMNQNLELKLSLLISNNHSTAIEKMNTLVEGDLIEDIGIELSDLTGFEMQISGISVKNLFSPNSFIFTPIPKFSGITTFVIGDKDYNDIVLQLNESKSHIRLTIQYQTGTIEIKASKGLDTSFDGIINFTHSDFCESISKETLLYEFLLELTKGQNIQVFDTESILYENKIEPIPEFEKLSKWYLDYFQLLKEVENRYRIRFTKIPYKDINHSTLKTVEMALSQFRGLAHNLTSRKEITIRGADIFIPFKEFKEQLNNGQKALSIEQSVQSEIELHGYTLQIGYKRVVIQDVVIVNISKNKEDFTVMSKSGLIQVLYTSNLDDNKTKFHYAMCIIDNFKDL